jgi:riboflavin biosynthesis pyrimidine reductase
MLIYSMSVSVDGFIADREGAFGWTAPNEEQFRFHIAQVRELGGHLCGRGAALAAAAIELGLVDELRVFRNPVVVGAARRSSRRSPDTSRWS